MVYILRSERNGNYYIGSTKDLERRLGEHLQGAVKATGNLRPLSLVFQQEYETIREAKQVEWKLKKFKSRNIIKRIIEKGKILITGD